MANGLSMVSPAPQCPQNHADKLMKIFVRAKPGAGEERVEKTSDNNFVVSVKEPPVKGRANAAIARALAKHFEVAFSQVRLVSGFSSKQKVFEIL